MSQSSTAKKMKQAVLSSTVATGIVLGVPTIADAALGDQTLRQGMNHSDVTQLQDELKSKGFFTYEKSTGYYGSITTDAVRSFQKANNLKVDGIAGPQTIGAIKGGSAKKATTSAPAPASNSTVSYSGILRVGSSGNQVTQLQSQLRSAGFLNKEPNGQYDNATRDAVRSFQQNKKLQVDGIAGPQTFAALNNTGSKAPAPSNQTNTNTNQAKPSASSSVLRVGSRGAAVTELQSQLRSVGVFNQNPTGYYGNDTRDAVRKFQSANGLSADGIAGPKTFAKLGQGSTYKPDTQTKNETVNNNSGATVTNLIAEASKHVGVPYVWGGATPAGFDCSGFIQYVFKQQGISVPRTAASQYSAGSNVSSLQVGDVVFFETYKSGPSHNGIYIGNNQFIHSGSSSGVTITSLDNSYWKPRYLGAKRF
ncbi:C40 family peptidase [Alkalicoccobacillus murimartini]|uniref:Peptidoglycan hydrolase-like protein with peptidoglycan-binding domain n=1 Tax=Alkalicoccobacillus murimartini TaxID=171685 RepID=A0ABT9YGN4_9BACI|nr:peptidoglycan-binding protein [Alkalicoccobacillus murimartini]MDQ0207002.1 peptidoglycan hydrolase-like protein with peptidoglycan-binding domain [Alkalicoccobacillus murimartini]